MDLLHLAVVFFGIVSVSESVCSNGWVRHDSNCYHFSHDKENWFSALGVCKLTGGTLIEINDADENNFVHGQVSTQGNHYGAFIALTDVIQENVWKWMVSNTTLTTGSFTNWDANQPNNGGGQQNCVVVNAAGLWNDRRCADSYYYICEKIDVGNAEVIG